MTEDFRLSEGTLLFSDSLRYIKGQQFAGREDIRRVILPPNIGFLEEEIFAECANLEEVVFSEGLVNIGVADFTSCESLKRLVLPSTLRRIEEGAFLSCTSLESILLPEGLEEIADLAFQDTGLTEVSIPASVARIGEEAFFECPKLCRADVLGADTKIGINAFGSNYALIEGFMAPGYPEERSASAELLYTLLWAGCPDRHGPETSARAERFIRSNEALIMERIFKFNNIPALTGLAERHLLSPENIDGYVRQAFSLDSTEITALLLAAKGTGRNTGEEFEL